jgi:hypothetical protein
LVIGDVELDEVDVDAGLARHRLQLAGLVDAADSAVDGVALLGEVDGCGRPIPLFAPVTTEMVMRSW